MDYFSADGLSYLYSVVKHRRRLLFIPLLIGIVATSYVLMSSPTLYKSTAVILVEEADVPKNLVQSTITSFVDQRIQLITRKVMTRQNLAEIVETFDLYPEMRPNVPMRVVLDRFRKDLEMSSNSVEISDPRSGRNREMTLTLNISFKSQDPELAQRVANEFATLFLNENVRSRTEGASEAASFLSGEAASLEEIIKLKEKQLAEFKEKYAGSLPEDTKFNKDQLERNERDLFEVDQRLQSLADRLIYLNSELANTEPNVVRYAKEGEVYLSPPQQLRTLEAEYLQLSSRYGKRHPDLVKLDKQIKALKAETGVKSESDPAAQLKISLLKEELEEKRLRYGSEHPEVQTLSRRIVILEQDLTNKSNQAVPMVVPDNPVYIQLETQRKSANAEIQSLEEKRRKLVAKLDLLNQKLAVAPKVESEYSALTREYSNLSSKFKEIKAHQMEAQLGESLEKGQKGDRFSMIEVPLVPLKPFAPNVQFILFVGLAGSLGAALGVVALFEIFDRRVYTASQLSSMVNVPVLVSVAHIEGSQAAEAERGRVFRIIVVGVVLIVLMVVVGWIR